MKKPIASILLSLLMIATVWTFATRQAQAQNETIIFNAALLAANELPPVAVVNPAEANAGGSAKVTLTVTRSGSTITAATATFEVSINGLSNSSIIILSHIHQGASNVNGPIVVDSGISPAAPVPAPTGSAFFTRTNLTVTPSIAQGIIDNPSGFYFNVHTALSPGGVARGQLVRQQAAGGAGLSAPTLSEWGAILMTLLIIAACVFFLIGRKSAIADAGDGLAPAAFTSSAPAIDWKLLAKVALAVEAVIALALVVMRAGAVDVLGALTSGLLAAFILHLLIRNARRR